MEVLCQDAPDAPFLRDFSCPVHALGPGWLGRFGLSSDLPRWLRQNIARFDGIVMQGIWTFPGTAVRRASRLSGVRYCTFAHGALDPWFNQRYPLKHLKKRLFWPIQYPVLRDAQVVFSYQLSGDGGGRTELHPQCVDPALVPERNSVSPRAILQPRSRRSIAISRLCATAASCSSSLAFSRRKGCDLLIDAFARVASAAPDLDLVMAGPDQVGWQAALRQRATELGLSQRIHWPGMLAGDLKWGALRAADVFSPPLASGELLHRVVESLAAGRPVLITNKVNICASDPGRRLRSGRRRHSPRDRTPPPPLDRHAPARTRRDDRPHLPLFP